MRNGAPGKQSHSTRVLRHLLTNGPATTDEIGQALGISDKAVRAAFHRLRRDRAITSTTRRLYAAVGGEDKFTARALETAKKVVEAQQPDAPRRDWFDV